MDIENETVSEREEREALERKADREVVHRLFNMSCHCLLLIAFPFYMLVGVKNPPITNRAKAGVAMLVVTIFLTMTSIMSCIVYPQFISSVKNLSRLVVIVYYLFWVTFSLALATNVDMAGWSLGITIALPPIAGLIIALCNKIKSAYFSSTG